MVCQTTISGDSRVGLWMLALILGGCPAYAQAPDEKGANPDVKAAVTPAPAKVDVNPVAKDEEIANRLANIMMATEWFENPRVAVREGVVFLEGVSATADQKEWATKLASNTEDVVAVANRMVVRSSSMWDFSPAWNELDDLSRSSSQSLPALFISMVLLLLALAAAQGVALLTRRIVSKRTDNPLLRDMIVKATALPIVLIGLYLALRTSGLTRLAATLLGGTGLVGLVLGIAFRDIAENFLASLLISVQRPFRVGDTINVDRYTGLVVSVTTRGTTIMTLEGHYVRIPNSTIYKSTLVNLTTNPKQRGNFTLSIPTDESLAKTQEMVLNVLKQHEAVLEEPEPLALVERLLRGVAILRVYFWTNVHKHDKEKVKSALLRLSKLAIDNRPSTPRPLNNSRNLGDPSNAESAPSTPAEGTLRSDDTNIKKQAREVNRPDEGVDLLNSTEK